MDRGYFIMLAVMGACILGSLLLWFSWKRNRDFRMVLDETRGFVKIVLFVLLYAVGGAMLMGGVIGAICPTGC